MHKAVYLTLIPQIILWLAVSGIIVLDHQPTRQTFQHNVLIGVMHWHLYKVTMAWQANSLNCFQAYLNKIIGTWCINSPGIALVGPGLQAPIVSCMCAVYYYENINVATRSHILFRGTDIPLTFKCGSPLLFLTSLIAFSMLVVDDTKFFGSTNSFKV